MRLCDFQTLLFDKFPSSISSFINIDYSKLDRHITFEHINHLHQKANNYIKTRKPNDSKLRENIMQQFYSERQDRIQIRCTDYRYFTHYIL